jgi:hypothetical protein
LKIEKNIIVTFKHWAFNLTVNVIILAPTRISRALRAIPSITESGKQVEFAKIISASKWFREESKNEPSYN